MAAFDSVDHDIVTEATIFDVEDTLLLIGCGRSRQTNHSSDGCVEVMDYCNAVLTGMDDVTLKRLQSVQNPAACLLSAARHQDHVTPPVLFSGRELAFTFANCRRNSVCRLSSVCLSVTLVRPTQPVEI